MPEEHFLVVGNGPAGHRAAMTLRERAPGARVTLISRDPESGYRPHLLPGFIEGKIPEQDLYISSLDSYKDIGIKLRSGQPVMGVDLERREIVLEHKEIIPFSGLIIAAGGTPRIPEPYRAFQDHLLRLKTLRDARRWVRRLSGAASVLIIGGDLTSLALTRTLLHLNVKVYFILTEYAFWPLRCDGALFDQVGCRLTPRGVTVLDCNRILDISPSPGRGFHVKLDTRELDVDLVGAFFGLVPDIGFLSGSGLRLDRGILVDEYLNAGFDHVYATGDCAQIYHPEIRDYWVSIGHDNAVELGRIAALNLLGNKIEAKVGAGSIFSDKGIRVNTSWWTEF